MTSELSTEDFIRKCAAEGISRRDTQIALDVSRIRFGLMLDAMEPLPWKHPGYSAATTQAGKERNASYTRPVSRAHPSATEGRRAQCLHTLPDGRSGNIPELLALVGGSVDVSSVQRRLREGWTLLDALQKPRNGKPTPGDMT